VVRLAKYCLQVTTEYFLQHETVQTRYILVPAPVAVDGQMSQIVEINGDISTKFERGPGSSLPAHGFMLCLCFIEIFN